MSTSADININMDRTMSDNNTNNKSILTAEDEEIIHHHIENHKSMLRHAIDGIQWISIGDDNSRQCLPTAVTNIVCEYIMPVEQSRIKVAQKEKAGTVGILLLILVVIIIGIVYSTGYHEIK